jgi:hypothetical protein
VQPEGRIPQGFGGQFEKSALTAGGDSGLGIAQIDSGQSGAFDKRFGRNAVPVQRPERLSNGEGCDGRLIRACHGMQIPLHIAPRIPPNMTSLAADVESGNVAAAVNEAPRAGKGISGRGFFS